MRLLVQHRQCPGVDQRRHVVDLVASQLSPVQDNRLNETRKNCLGLYSFLTDKSEIAWILNCNAQQIMVK